LRGEFRRNEQCPQGIFRDGRLAFFAQAGSLHGKAPDPLGRFNCSLTKLCEGVIKQAHLAESQPQIEV